MNCIYPLLRIRYFLARGGIEPRGRCFYTTTPAGLFLIIPLIEQSLPPLIYNRLLRKFLCPNCRATSLMPVCIAGPTSDQTATNRHESPRIAIAVFGSVWYPSAQHTQKNALSFALHAAVIMSGQQARYSAMCVRTGHGGAMYCRAALNILQLLGRKAVLSHARATTTSVPRLPRITHFKSSVTQYLAK